MEDVKTWMRDHGLVIDDKAMTVASLLDSIKEQIEAGHHHPLERTQRYWKHGNDCGHKGDDDE